MKPLSSWFTLVIGLGGIALGAEAQSSVISRTVETPAGWSRLELPADVLANARADLADVRLQSTAGELGYAWQQDLVVEASELVPYDVVSLPGQETTALVDRGARASLASCLELEFAGTEPLLKPLTVEASTDGASYALLARGSVFRANLAHAGQLCFPPSDHRYLRLRLDDRNSEPARPERVRLDARVLEQTGTTLGVSWQRQPATSDNPESYAITLPSRQLPLRSLRLQVLAEAFSRRVSVYERLLYRGEMSRRLVTEARVERSVRGDTRLDVPLGPVSGIQLEVVFEAAGQPLQLSGAEVSLESRALVFLAPSGASLRLEYGNPGATAPHYDVAEVLSRGLPRSLNEAKLGPGESRSIPAERAKIPRGAPLRPEDFHWSRSVVLPPSAEVEQAAYLDLVDTDPEHTASLRLLDSRNRQVPYVRETLRRATPVELQAAEPRAKRRVFDLVAAGEVENVTRLELNASAPEFFSRAVEVFRDVRDQRGVVRQETLASGTWERRPGDPASNFSLELPSVRGSEMHVAIDDGDNAPLELGAAIVTREQQRLDFFYQLGDQLTLVAQQPSLAAPSYDLGLIGDRLLQSPALEARLAAAPPALVNATAERDLAWFWIALTAVGAALALVLVRAMLGDRKSDGSGN